MSSPAGWYPQPDGRQRYWDGELWTEHFAPGSGVAETLVAEAKSALEVRGHNGTVVLDRDFVTITRTGFLARATLGKGEKRIPVASITAVQWKPAGPMVNGFIQFTLGGGNESRSKFGSQTANAVKDENSVIFLKKQMPEFEVLRAAIEHAIAERHRPNVMTPVVPDHLAQLTQLAALRDAGVVSEGEFAATKAQILSRM
jgi:Domain of unknown function (DUF4429)/Protein of unknown function (DUF2510)